MVEGEPTTVEARFSEAGEIVPRRFTYQGRWLAVEGVGHRWEEAGERCFKLLAAGGRLFELRLDGETLRWRITDGPVPGMVA